MLQSPSIPTIWRYNKFMKFGFIAHVNNKDERNMLKCLNQINQLLSSDGGPPKVKNSFDFVEFGVTSKTGAFASGKITYLPWYPKDILNDSEGALQEIKNIAVDLEEWGAEIIGLGGYTAAIGGRGVEVQKALKKARVTTGNSFTTATSIDTLYSIRDKLGFSIDSKFISVVGFPGSISLAITKIMSRTGAMVQVVGRSGNQMAEKLLENLDAAEAAKVTFAAELDESIRKADIIFSATTTGAIIDQTLLKPGAIVIDIGVPKDVIEEGAHRDDVLVVDGGRFSFSDEVSVDLPFSNFLQTNFFGCVGETILIALENDYSYCSLGRILKEDNVMAIRKIGHKHGFVVDGLASYGTPISDGEVLKLKKHMTESAKKGKDDWQLLAHSGKEDVFEKYKKHVNSMMISMLKAGNYDRLYVKAEGINVWDSEGAMYYDFVGGYGSVNIGHNHPAIVSGIKKYFELSPPSLLQVSPGYFTSLLSERLTDLLPDGLNKVFFCNSGAEAVEGALKLARIYTGRDKYISTVNSFHGKTYGALSVTGREKYQKHFRPLLDGVSFVDYGDLDALDIALQSLDAAAVILEPIQGEGGVVVPETGYLKKCQEICRKYGTLLIVDEVQTGFGRTGKMFALEHDGFVPDIITLAKSLGGSLVPIAAYVTHDEIWEKSYGSEQKYLLHTSTFGGNNFCASVAISALDVMVDEKLAENSAKIGGLLLAELKEISNRYHFIEDVRGLGLLIGIEFKYSLDNGIDNLINFLASMVPSKYTEILSSFPSKILDSMRNFLDENTVNIESFLCENFATQLSAFLLNDYNVITIVTLNNPNVIRIEPPLTITERDARYFLDSFAAVCDRFKFLDGE